MAHAPARCSCCCFLAGQLLLQQLLLLAVEVLLLLAAAAAVSTLLQEDPGWVPMDCRLQEAGRAAAGVGVVLLLQTALLQG